jgi:predicted lipoprotein with Yx(FWY)xxD motif
MKPLISLATIAAGLALAACGGASSSGNASSANTSAAGSLVSVRQVSGVGPILVDGDGQAVYTNDQESGGNVLCTGPCTAFWKPVISSAGKPAQTPKARKLGVLTRPDGTKQLTSNGKPLYTFSEDSPGTLKGNNFTDDLGGHHFTWHVTRANATTANTAGKGSNATGGGNGASPNASYPSY